MIPKIIHYCWFGRNPKPELAEKCINSWKKYCPDFEIIEWNEENYSISDAPLYVQQAYEAKKWAFVTDYVRLWALTTIGGIYMDTDVELLKPIYNFLIHEAFSGFDSIDYIPTGIMGCIKQYRLFQEFLHYYDDSIFINDDGTMNTNTNCYIITEICLKYGLRRNDTFQEIRGCALYPTEVFCPLSHDTGELNTTDKTVAIHWFAGSWIDPEQRKQQVRAQRIGRVIGIERAWIILGIFNVVKREGFISYVRQRLFRRKKN